MKRGEIEGKLNSDFYHPERTFALRSLTSASKYMRVVRLIDVVNFERDQIKTPGENYLGLAHIQSHTGELTEANESVLGNCLAYQNGDVLFSRLRPYLNKVYCADMTGCCSTEFYVLRVKDRREILPEYLANILRSALVLAQTIHMTTGNTHPRLTNDDVEALQIPLPPIVEQEKLVAAMDAARAERNAKLAEADALLASLDDFVLAALGIAPPPEDKRRVFAVKGRVSSHRFDPYFHSPHFARISDLLSQTSCQSLEGIATFSEEMWRPEDHPAPTFRYIEISTVSPQTGQAVWNEVATSEAPSRARMKVQPNDIIVSLTRPHHGSIALLNSDFEGCIASTGFAVIREVAQHVSREYLWCVLRVQICLRQMLQRSSGGNYPAITEPELAKIIVPVPDMGVQNAIATEIQHRHQQSAMLRSQAEAGWREAKEWFERELLGDVNTNPSR